MTAMWNAPSCPKCGATQARREAKGFVCSFCGATLRPRLTPGDRCADAKDRGVCGASAESLCRTCAVPLCRRHSTRRPLYWRGPLDAARLFPAWAARDASDWSSLSNPMQRFPLDDFTPFPWAEHLRKSDYAVGRIEDQIREGLRGVVGTADAEVIDDAVWIESICRGCESVLGRQIDKKVMTAAPRYVRVAFVDRLAALRTDLEQTVRYVEAFLGRPISRRKTKAGFSSVGVRSSRSDWDACGQEAQARLATSDRLQRLLR